MPTKTDPIDPLEAKAIHGTAAAQAAVKREISNILHSYVGWFDPFSELVQNALDSVDEQAKRSGQEYTPTIRILIDVEQNSLTVTDNGTGLNQETFKQFLAPSFSFKSGKTRGHKGVGATYLAYGFNHIQIATRTPDYEYTAKMEGARNWLTDPSPASNPLLVFDKSGPHDREFKNFPSGVSITVKFDSMTVPGKLSWLVANDAKTWKPILTTKTGLGAILEELPTRVHLTVKSEQGITTKLEWSPTAYNWPHLFVPKSKSLKEVQAKSDELHAKLGKDYRMPAAFRGLDCIYETYRAEDILTIASLSEEEKHIIRTHTPMAYMCYAYSARVFSDYNDSLNIRASVQILKPGIQICANDMPQGEIVQIPLSRNIGRQNQVHFVGHFENCTSDLGRKGFQKEIVSFCESISRKLMEGPFLKQRHALKPATGAKSDLGRETAIDDWKSQMEQHEKISPLTITSPHFFHPTNRVAVTSVPTREQDVIALFNQLVAGGVIRGLRIMSTNERFTYDGMYKVSFSPPKENHIYEADRNPLGIQEDNFQDAGFESKPKILEYKFSLDGLIEDFESGEKNAKDIGLVIVWETGKLYEKNFHIVSLLDEDNLSERQYHGVTHVLQNYQSSAREMDMIVLSELIEFLNDPVLTTATQKAKYDS